MAPAPAPRSALGGGWRAPPGGGTDFPYIWPWLGLAVWRRACPCRSRSRCWRWWCLRPVPASSSSSWASSRGSWPPESGASQRAPTARASRRWPGPGWRWTASSRCHPRRDSSRLARLHGGPAAFLRRDTCWGWAPLGWQPCPFPPWAGEKE
uniref:Uncharacterized protein n=1 Tax=Oryctolagus cuniculus TaxID=9986 RepID=A0A5F9DFX1_RABIT